MIARLATILDHPSLYRAWQIPFMGSKVDALKRHNDFSRIGRVLDVGCGPAMNTQYFVDADYLGLDISDFYIEHAKRRFPNKRFVVADVRTFEPPNDSKFDFILVNSILHHLNDHDTCGVLSMLPRLLEVDGCVHIIELVMPECRGIPYWLAKNDRGKYPRSLTKWHEIFSQIFDSVIFEPFSSYLFGKELIQLVYFKGRKRAT